MKEPLCKKETANITINSEPPKPITFEDLGYVQVVRCKDCNECYFASNRIPSEQTLVCGKHGIDISPDWFYADGERKEGR